MFKRFSFAAALTAAFFLLSGCNGAPGQNGANASEDDEEEIAVPVEAEVSTRDTVFASYRGTTTLEADREADIVAKASGVILELLVEEGDLVEADQVVARLDRDRLELELNRNRASLERLKSDIMDAWQDLDGQYELVVEPEIFWRLGGPPEKSKEARQ